MCDHSFFDWWQHLSWSQALSLVLIGALLGVTIGLISVRAAIKEQLK